MNSFYDIELVNPDIDSYYLKYLISGEGFSSGIVLHFNPADYAMNDSNLDKKKSGHEFVQNLVVQKLIKNREESYYEYSFDTGSFQIAKRANQSI